MSVLYVYAFLGPGSEGPTPQGVGGERVRILGCGRVRAAVENMPVAPPLDAAALRAHDETVRALASGTDAVLPARFGSALPDAEGVRAFVAAHEEALAAALDLVRGCDQMTLRVFARSSEADLVSRRRSAESVAAGEEGPGTRYLTARAAARPDPRRTPEVADVLAAVAGLTRAEKLEPHDQPPLLASVYHLVPRANLDAYTRRLQDASAAEVPLRVTWSGPWPAYSFVPDDLA